jgi:glycosyltransferase involved in cell wall biosynthesis
LRIVILTQYFYPEVGAAPIRYYEIARELKEKGYEVLILTTFPSHRMETIPEKYKGKFLMREKIKDLDVFRVWSFPSSGNLKKRLLAYFSFVFSALFGLLFIEKYDLILVHSPPLFTGISACIASFIRRTPFIFNVSDLWPETAVELGLVKNKFLIKASERLESFIYRRAWKVIAVTEGIKEALIEKGLPREKVTFLPNGADLDIFTPKKRREELVDALGLNGKKVFVYTGNFGYAQGAECILQAALYLQNEENIHFLLVGDGPDKPKLLRFASEKNLKNVQFIEAQPFDVISDYYALSVASIVPLRKRELFKGARPSKVFTSLACQKPVIYCGEGETARLIEEVGCGIVVEPENSEKLKEAVLELSKNLKLAEEMGRRGRNFVEKNYTWKFLISQWLDEVNLSQGDKK